MNKVTLIGRLTRDPDIRYTSDNTAIARYTLAVNRRIKSEGQPDADFINCFCFNKSAEFVEKYLYKGMKIAVNGEWRSGSYDNKDGQKVYTNECLVFEHEFVESKSNSNSVNTNVAATPPTQPSSDGFMNIPDNVDDSGLPFNF